MSNSCKEYAVSLVAAVFVRTWKPIFYH